MRELPQLKRYKLCLLTSRTPRNARGKVYRAIRAYIEGER